MPLVPPFRHKILSGLKVVDGRGGMSYAERASPKVSFTLCSLGDDVLYPKLGRGVDTWRELTSPLMPDGSWPGSLESTSRNIDIAPMFPLSRAPLPRPSVTLQTWCRDEQQCAI